MIGEWKKLAEVPPAPVDISPVEPSPSSIVEPLHIKVEADVDVVESTDASTTVASVALAIESTSSSSTQEEIDATDAASPRETDLMTDSEYNWHYESVPKARKQVSLTVT